MPLLVMQGALDDNVLPAIQEKFAGRLSRRRRRLRVSLVRKLRPSMGGTSRAATDKAQETVKAFIARQLARRS